MDSHDEERSRADALGWRGHLGQFLLSRVQRTEEPKRPRRGLLRWRRVRLLLLVLVLAIALPGVLWHLGGANTNAGQVTTQPTASAYAPASSPASTPSSESSRGAGGPQVATIPADDCGITNIEACLSDFINNFLSSIANWWQTQVNNVVSLGFMFYTPPPLTYDAPIVQQIQAYSLTVIAAVLALFFAIAGYNYMAGRSVSWTEILPQIFFCGMMAWGIQALLVFAIDGSNDFILGLQGVNLNNVITGKTDTSTMGLIAFIFELVLDLGLSLEALARLALLDFLLAIAPIGIFCFALPQTRAWGRLWAEGFVAALLIQPLQAVIVLIASSFMSNLVQLFGPNFPPIAQLLLGMASVYLAIRVPSMLSRVTHMAGDLRGQVTRAVMAAASAAA